MTKLIIDIHPADDGGHVIDIIAGTPPTHRRHFTTHDNVRDVLNLANAEAHALIDELAGRTIEADDLERIDNDAYGNPRHVVHYLTLGLESYDHDDRTKRAGLEKYGGKKYGGMFIVPGYGTKTQLAHELTRIFYPDSTNL